jgi:leucyl aminopeptidase
MDIRFADQRPANAHALALPVVQGGPVAAGLDPTAAALARDVAAAQRFDGETASLAELFIAEDGATRRLVLLGIGIGTAPEPIQLERAGAALVARLLTSGETRLVIDLTAVPDGLDRAQAAARLAFGAALRAWRHDVYRTKLPEKSRASLEEIVVVGGGVGAEAAWARLAPVAEGVFLARTLVTEPANVIYPESFVERCRPLADLGIVLEVLDETAMRTLGMGALLGVSQGSAREARLLVMRWDGTEGTQPRPLALVGKGVTFDTGGISIKPAGGMEDMKWDMGGAAAVAGTMLALAGRKAKAHVIGVCGLVENMPSGTAQRPGDVVTSMSGQTIEVINTDAEGRLVLCDALTWVQRNHRPDQIVDLATLTGAMIIALGHEYGGLFANDDGLAEELIAAGKASGDPLWRLPLGEAYDKLIDSPIADIKNVGPRPGGSITAAQFLKRFIDDGVKWAHLDIAGMVWAAKPGATWDKGATGFGVRLLDRFVEDVIEG